MHGDAQRIAKRFHETWQTTLPAPNVPWEDAAPEYRESIVKVFDEMLRAELIFGGPSLYADPAV